MRWRVLLPLNPRHVNPAKKIPGDCAAPGLTFVATVTMNIRLLLPTLLIAALPASLTLAADAKKTDAEIINAARASYPLKTCLVSNEALGSMGEASGHIHRTAGKPDRVVFFCCAGCSDDFKADPAKFLKKLDEAAANKAKK
jgi:hypothetical protein